MFVVVVDRHIVCFVLTNKFLLLLFLLQLNFMNKEANARHYIIERHDAKTWKKRGGNRRSELIMVDDVIVKGFVFCCVLRD